ncbi:hypothetical protein [Arthrobacter psychrochitiniphilus]|uniref:hypothetical protein n=1 Tax=Arthrobacter psychrochitiniphilus TaxID=291045 RepID=UPI003F7C20CA
MADLAVAPQHASAEGRTLTGIVKAVDITPEVGAFLEAHIPDDAPSLPSFETTYGLVLAEAKAYVPNQQHRDNGEQQAMDLAGDDWDPVENLYVWFCPFGNMFATIAESNSSPRAGIFAIWLSKVMNDKGMLSSDATGGTRQLAVKPVIDTQRASILQSADGLKKMTVAGLIGHTTVPATGFDQLFRGQNLSVGALKVEISVSTVRGISDHDDEEQILDFYQNVFGSLQGDITKAQVTTAADDVTDMPATEIDLLHHRLTRSTRIPLQLGETHTFEALPTIGRIVSAFEEDGTDLLRIHKELQQVI